MSIFAAIMKAIESIDTLRTAVLDTTGKTDMEKTLIEKLTLVHETPADQLLPMLWEKALHFGLKLLAAIAIYLIGGYLIKLVKKLLSRYFTRRNTAPAVASFTMSLTSFALWVILIVMVVGTLGIETTSFAALLAAGGMAIGMALSGAVQNFAGGVMILIFKPFEAGDFIAAQGFSGTVSEVNITSTKIITPDNREIVLPNGALSSGTVDNYSKKEFRRVEVKFGAEYGTAADDVRSVLLNIATEDQRVLTTEKGAPADPYVAISALSDSSVDFILRVWVRSELYWDVFYDLNEKVYTELPKHGINFPFPQLTVHMDN